MKKILIVDDSLENLYLLEVLFTAKGFKVISATDGKEALKQAGSEAPDIIISDILMPGMDGYSLCKAWKNDGLLKDIPFIFYTATYTDIKDEEFACSLGAERFVKKPIDTEELFRIVEDVLKESRTKKAEIQEVLSEESVYFKQYNEALIRKLEQKMLQLEKTNEALLMEIAERKAVQEALSISLQEKKALISELYHRTRNNMQLICSLLTIKLAFTPSRELSSFVTDIYNRIRSMALVHQKLYEAKNLSSINLADYIKELCESLVSKGGIFKGQVSFEYDLDEINVIIELAAPFGLVLNELVSNSLKHAFQEGQVGRIKLSLHQTPENFIEFSYSDNGKGLPEGFDFQSDGRMGFELISMLGTSQLMGTICYPEGSGFHFSIQIKKQQANTFLKA